MTATPCIPSTENFPCKEFYETQANHVKFAIVLNDIKLKVILVIITTYLKVSVQDCWPYVYNNYVGLSYLLYK